jgi:hypothetical protein
MGGLVPADPELQHFARSLVQQVRDQAIDACDRLLAGDVGGVRAARWQDVLQNSDARSAVAALLPDIVDQALFELLDRIDNDDLPLAWRQGNGTWIPLSDLGDGTMAGRLMMGQGGWLSSFSGQRFADYTGGVRLSDEENGGQS